MLTAPTAAQDPAFAALEQRLLALGGTRVVYVGPDPDLPHILTRGHTFPGKATMQVGIPCRCHQNAAELWAADSARMAIATGYALSPDGLWRQHSWVILCDKPNRAIETTIARTLYFGFILTPTEAEAFYWNNG